MSETSTTRKPLRWARVCFIDTNAVHGVGHASWRARSAPRERVHDVCRTEPSRGNLRRVDRVLAVRFRMERSVALEVLHLAFVLLGGLARFEGAEVPPLPGLRILLPGVESVPTGLQLLDHVEPPFVSSARQYVAMPVPPGDRSFLLPGVDSPCPHSTIAWSNQDRSFMRGKQE